MDKVKAKSVRPSSRLASAVLLCVFAAAAFFLWNHPDIQETARHTHILLDDVFSGRFFEFYQDTMDGRAIYGYTNAAHYHIVFYLLCAVWDLPLYLLSQFVAVSDFVFVLWTKLVGVGAWVACGFLLRGIARKLDIGERWTPWMPYCFWLCPISFFTVLAMGQYDSVCLAFLLWALALYLDDKMPAFALVMGAAVVFKMFAVFLAIPLLLLREKRLVRLAGYGVLCLWLYVPGALLFAGRNGDAGFFNSLIADRLFAAQLPFFGSPSLFLTLLALVYALCWAWRPSDAKRVNEVMPYLCLAVLTLLFLCVEWHPQWLILLTPFALLTTAKSPHPMWWCVLQAVFAASFFILIAYHFPGQIEANLFDAGVLGEWAGLLLSAQETVRTNDIYFSLIPYAYRLAGVGFSAVPLAALVGKLPLRGGTLEKKLDSRAAPCPPALYAWGVFVIGFGCFWLAPTVYGWLRSFGL